MRDEIDAGYCFHLRAAHYGGLEPSEARRASVEGSLIWATLASVHKAQRFESSHSGTNKTFGLHEAENLINSSILSGAFHIYGITLPDALIPVNVKRS
jgi:hypothetical protein